MLRRILGFASLTLATQLVLLLQQVLLLPAQIHLWGHAATAAWYEAVALAAMTNMADLGLRGAGHTELLRLAGNAGDAPAQRDFAAIWAWIRLLVTGLTLLLCLVLALGQSAPWRLAIILAGGIETLLVIRIAYLDSLGRYNAAEGSYLVFAALRLGASLAAVLLFGAGPPVTAAIYLLSVAAVLLWQSIVCADLPSLALLRSLAALRNPHALRQARHTLASPAALWAQMHFPVLVLGAIAAPVTVTAYVTLRAIFGVVRQAVLQAARIASVEYLRHATGRARAAAEDFVALLGIAIACMAAWLTALLLFAAAPVQRAFNLADAPLLRTVTLSFGLAACFLTYQIVLAVLMRSGNIARIAHRQYLYVALALLVGGAALLLQLPLLLLAGLAGAEILMALLFLRTPLGFAKAGLAASLLSSACLLVVANGAPAAGIAALALAAIAITLLHRGLLRSAWQALAAREG